jgi:hypothetical protein
MGVVWEAVPYRENKKTIELPKIHRIKRRAKAAEGKTTTRRLRVVL